MNSIRQNLMQIKAKIAVAAEQAGRLPQAIQLIAVSKQQSLAAIEQAIAAGHTSFGESRVQDALPKLLALSHLPLEWHFIGAIQTNKTKLIAEHFAWVHSLCQLKHAMRLNAQRPKHLPPLQVCVQVKLNTLTQRQGIEPAELFDFAAKLARLPRLCLRGLMLLPTVEQSLAADPAPFRQLALLLQQLKIQHPRLDSLSMGMSADYKLAIAEGATQVRIGSAIFRGD